MQRQLRQNQGSKKWPRQNQNPKDNLDETKVLRNGLGQNHKRRNNLYETKVLRINLGKTKNQKLT